MGSDTSMALKKTGGIVTRILHKWGMGLHGVVTVFATRKSDGIVIRILHLGVGSAWGGRFFCKEEIRWNHSPLLPQCRHTQLA